VAVSDTFDGDALYSPTRWTVRQDAIDRLHMTTDIARQEKPVVGFHVIGLCPRCGHDTSDIFPVEYVTEDIGGFSGLPPLSQFTARYTSQSIAAHLVSATSGPISKPWRVSVAVLHCHCVETHSGDGGSLGCGAEWLVQAEYNLFQKEDNPIYAVSPDAQVRYWAAADSLSATTVNSLTSVQATAAKWVTGLGGILGLIGVATVITGRDTFQELDSGAQGFLVAFAVLFVAASAVSIFLSNLASSGFPSVRSPRNPPDLIDADLWPIRQARQAVSKLRIATYCAGFALVTAACAVGTIWLGPTAPSVSKVSIIVAKSSPSPTMSVICGTLPSTQPSPTIPGTVNFQPSGASSPSSYPLSSIAGITPPSC
jgi:hypothetical protein